VGSPWLVGRSRREFHADAIDLALLGDDTNPDALTQRLEVQPERIARLGRLQEVRSLIPDAVSPLP
jgi:hypothetical protein